MTMIGHRFVVVDLDDPFCRLSAYVTRRGMQFRIEQYGIDRVVAEVNATQVKFLRDEMNKYLADYMAGGPIDFDPDSPTYDDPTTFKPIRWEQRTWPHWVYRVVNWFNVRVDGPNCNCEHCRRTRAFMDGDEWRTI